MKKFTKSYALLAVFGLVLAMAACSNSSSPAAPVVFPPTDTSGSESAGGGSGGNPGGGGTGGKTAATIEFANEYVGKIVSDGVFTNKLNNLGDGAVAYESSDTGVATVDAATGQVTIVAEGTTTIKATVADSETYEYAEKTASYILTVHSEDAKTPLTIEIKSGMGILSGRVTVKNAWSSLKYKFSNSEESHEYTGPIDITAGVPVSFFADGSENPNSLVFDSDKFFSIECNVDCYVYGNVNSLLDSNNFFTEINNFCAFSYLFKASGAHVYNHPTKDLYLPSNTATNWCYSYMFAGCGNLQRAPKLPATKLSRYCYSHMFAGCSGLTAAPALPATTLGEGCYEGMFTSCSKLAAAPALPAMTLTDGCYRQMFQGCSALTTAPELPAKKLTQQCYSGMFTACDNLKTAPKLQAMELASNCYAAMFSNCSSLTSPPNLPATTLEEACYSGMFRACVELTKAPVLNATILVKYCYFEMFSGCSKLANVYCFATDISAPNCTSNWLKGVAATGEFNRSRLNTSWQKNSPDGVPNGWTEWTD